MKPQKKPPGAVQGSRSEMLQLSRILLSFGWYRDDAEQQGHGRRYPEKLHNEGPPPASDVVWAMQVSRNHVDFAMRLQHRRLGIKEDRVEGRQPRAIPATNTPCSNFGVPWCRAAAGLGVEAFQWPVVVGQRVLFSVAFLWLHLKVGGEDVLALGNQLPKVVPIALNRVPSARSIQELVQAWKQMRKWK